MSSELALSGWSSRTSIRKYYDDSRLVPNGGESVKELAGCSLDDRNCSKEHWTWNKGRLFELKCKIPISRLNTIALLTYFRCALKHEMLVLILVANVNAQGRF